ncbi:hypothetical protein LZ31DRAFT_133089 [Colletotrichum somersetense]|nr:hypothetical protein LZ31DRAFT_133089 [Colletotrichum somersetense]
MAVVLRDLNPARLAGTALLSDVCAILWRGGQQHPHSPAPLSRPLKLLHLIDYHVSYSQRKAVLKGFSSALAQRHRSAMKHLMRLQGPYVYTIGWITALDKNLTEAQAVLDDEHQKPESFRKHSKDTNIR